MYHESRSGPSAAVRLDTLCAIRVRLRIWSGNPRDRSGGGAGARMTRTFRTPRGRTMGATLDAKGLNCPMPLIRTRLALKAVAVGETLTVWATDPTSYVDIRLFCETTDQELVSAEEEEAGVYTYVIRKGAEF